MGFQTATLISTALVSLSLALQGCGEGHQDAASESGARRISAPVAVAAVSQQASEHAAPATLIAVDRASVASRLMGYLREMQVVEGQKVQKGQPLFTVDPVDVSGQMEQARLSVQLAEDAYRDAQADFTRYGNLHKEEAISHQQYEKAKLQHDMAKARLAQARAGFVTAQGQMRYATVTAPIAGVVVQKMANAGDLASPGQPILVIENPDRLQIETQVPEDVFRRIRLGQVVPAEMEGAAQRIEARVARLSPAADPVSRTFMVKLDIPQGGWHSGSFARVLFPLETRQVLSVPVAALTTRAGIEGLFVINADGLAEFRMIRSGARQNGQVEVLAGLTAGERYITQATAQLESGDRVSALAAGQATVATQTH